MKLRGVERAFRDLFGPVEVLALKVDPLTPLQPIGLDETLRGL